MRGIWSCGRARLRAPTLVAGNFAVLSNWASPANLAEWNRASSATYALLNWVSPPNSVSRNLAWPANVTRTNRVSPANRASLNQALLVKVCPVNRPVEVAALQGEVDEDGAGEVCSASMASSRFPSW